MKKSKQKSREALEAEIKMLRASLRCNLAVASKQLGDVTNKRFMASGVIVSITSLNGSPLVEPFVCSDGLTQETVSALRKQIQITKNISEIIPFVLE